MKEVLFQSTIGVTPVTTAGGDYMVVAAAKVSTNGLEAKLFANPEHAEPNYKLIRFLMEHRHGTPFEHSFLTFFVHAPIFVWREWHRHRIGFSYNEESGRYKQLEPLFYLPPENRPMLKIDTEKWKPGRPKFRPLETTEDNDKFKCLITNLKHCYTDTYARYEQNLEMGFDPGIARACLPVGIYSGCWVSCNPRSLMAFLSLRHHEPTAKFVSYPLWEIDVAAQAVERVLATGWPLTHQAFVEMGRVGP